MSYKTIKEEFPEYKHHEEHMHQLRETHKHKEKELTKKLMGSVTHDKPENEYE